MPYNRRPDEKQKTAWRFQKAMRDNELYTVAELLFRKGYHFFAGNCPLHYAIDQNNLDLAQLLLHHGAHYNQLRQRLTPLALAQRDRNNQLIRLFQQYHQLFSACHNNNIRSVQRLLTSSISIWVSDSNGNTPLHLAARNGNEELVRLLLTYGARICDLNLAQQTATQLAQSNNHGAITKLLTQHQKLFTDIETNIVKPDDITANIYLTARNRYNNALLHEAAYWNNKELTIKLLELHADIEQTGDTGNTPLHIAARHNHNDLIIILLEHRANIDAVNIRQAPAIASAVYYGFTDTVRLLINRGANTKLLDHHGYNLMHQAVDADNPEMIRLLADLGFDIEFREAYGRTPLLTAAWNGKPQSLLQLIALGANTHATDNQGRGIFHCLCRQGRHEISQELAVISGQQLEPYFPSTNNSPHSVHSIIFLAQGLLLRSRYNELPIQDAARHALNFPPNIDGPLVTRQLMDAKLFHAITLNQQDYIERYVELYGDLSTIRNNRGETPIHFLLEIYPILTINRLALWRQEHQSLLFDGSSYLACLDFLLKHQRQLNIFNKIDESPLFAAIKIGGEIGLATTKKLLQAGANPMLTNRNGISSLPFACASYPEPALFRLLHEYGANLDITANKGHTLLSYILSRYQRKTAYKNIFPLAVYLAEQYVTCHISYAPLMTYIAACRDKPELITRFCTINSNIHRDKNGYTALHVAATKKIAIRLIANNFDPNDQKNRRQTTALHLALQYRLKESVAFELIEYLCQQTDINLQNIDGNTPLHVCLLSQHFHWLGLILASEPNAEITNNDNKTALEMLATHGCLTADIAKKYAEPCCELLSYGADYNNCTTQLLIIAIYAKHRPLFDLLLNRNVDINTPHNGISPLQIAAFSDRDGYFITQLLNHRAFTEYCEPKHGRSALFFAHDNARGFALMANHQANIHAVNRLNHNLLWELIDCWQSHSSDQSGQHFDDKQAILSLLLSNRVTVTQEHVQEAKLNRLPDEVVSQIESGLQLN